MRASRDRYYLNMLKLVAERSTCARRSVGAIITDKHGRVLSTGYNGVPSGVPHCTDSACPGATDVTGDTRRCMSVHAETNALLQCAKMDLASVLYVSCSPCFACAKMILNTPIKRVVCAERYSDTEGIDLLGSNGIQIVMDNGQWD